MINIGIIGCGTITRIRHAPEYAANKDALIAGFYDPVEERAVELAERYGGAVYHSYEDLLSNPSIDAVSVCSSNSTHAPITIAALEANKHVLCEKPMATTIPDAQKMIDSAKKTGKYLMIAHNQRLEAAHVKAKEILSNGEMGRIICFKSSFSHKGPELWSVAKSVNTWFFNKNEAAMGVIIDLGIHKADLLRWLIQDEIDEVVAMVMTLDKKDINGKPIEIDDNAMFVLRSKTGIAGTISVGWTNYGNGYRDNGTTLFCSEGVMRIYENPEYPIEIIRRTGDKTQYQFKPGIMDHGQANTGVVDQFVNCIKTGKTPEISGEEGLAALKIVCACMESSATGKKVHII